MDYATDDPRVAGMPDGTVFTRTEAQEMLYFIHYCYWRWNWPEYAKSPGRKIEKLVRTFIPADIRTQESVFAWIEEHWRHYWDLIPGR